VPGGTGERCTQILCNPRLRRLTEGRSGGRLDKVALVPGTEDLAKRLGSGRGAERAERPDHPAARLRMREIERAEEKLEAVRAPNLAKQLRRLGLHGPERIFEEDAPDQAFRLPRRILRGPAQRVESGRDARMARAPEKRRLAPLERTRDLPRREDRQFGVDHDRDRLTRELDVEGLLGTIHQEGVGDRCVVIHAALDPHRDPEARRNPSLGFLGLLEREPDPAVLLLPCERAFQVGMPGAHHPLIEEAGQVLPRGLLEGADQIDRFDEALFVPADIELHRLPEEVVPERTAQHVKDPSALRVEVRVE